MCLQGLKHIKGGGRARYPIAVKAGERKRGPYFLFPLKCMLCNNIQNYFVGTSDNIRATFFFFFSLSFEEISLPFESYVMTYKNVLLGQVLIF